MLKNSDKVSVIVPIFNAEKYAEEFFDALFAQSYPKENFEVIVIDNGSTDRTPEIVKKFPVKYITEKDKKSPYAARNKGFDLVTGEFIALIDVNKIPNMDWLKEGLAVLKSRDADLVGGAIHFSLPNYPTAANLYDSMTFNNNHRFVTQEGGAAAGNLLFRRFLIDKVGVFPDQFRSGMDIWWTQRAVRSGYKLEYAGNAIVYCKPRNFREILAKSYRVGKIHPFNQRQNGVSLPSIIGKTVKTFAPPGFRRYKYHQVNQQSNLFTLKVWLVAWMSKVSMGIGRAVGLIILKNYNSDHPDSSPTKVIT